MKEGARTCPLESIETQRKRAPGVLEDNRGSEERAVERREPFPGIDQLSPGEQERPLVHVAAGDVVDDGHDGQVGDPVAEVFYPAAQVDVLGVEEEALVEAAKSL